jgi:hypothetical protein
MHLTELKNVSIADIVDKLRSRGFLVEYLDFNNVKESIEDFKKDHHIENSDKHIYMEFYEDTVNNFENDFINISHDFLTKIWKKDGDLYSIENWEKETNISFISKDHIKELSGLMRFSSDELIEHLDHSNVFYVIIGKDNIMPFIIEQNNLTTEDKENICEYTMFKIKDIFHSHIKKKMNEYLKNSFLEWQLKNIGNHIEEKNE